MKITKHDGVRKASFQAGLLYNSQEEIAPLENYVEQRISEANKNTVAMYSVFRRCKKPPRWQTKVDACIRRGEWQGKLGIPPKNPQDSLERFLKPPFQEYAEDLAHLSTLPKEAQAQLCLDIKRKRDEEIAALEKRRNKMQMTNSLQGQACNLLIENNKLTYRNSPSNICWSRLFLSCKDNLLESKITDIVEFVTENLLRELPEDAYGPQLDYLMEKKRVLLSGSDIPAEMHFWVEMACSAYKDGFKKYEKPYTQPLKKDRVCGLVLGKLKAHITSRLLEYGKLYYHACDEDGNLRWPNHTFTSFDLEAIKATETLTQKTNTAIMHAITNMARVVNAQKDITLCQPEEIPLNAEAFRKFTTFFGGQTFFLSAYMNFESALDKSGELPPRQLAVLQESLALLKALRNAHFHYDAIFNESDIRLEEVKILFRQECQLQVWFILQKYASNNIDLYYSEPELQSLVQNICNRPPKTGVAFVPAFRRLNTCLKKIFSDAFGQGAIHDASTWFLLQEIYTRCFLAEPNYADMCINLDDIRPTDVFMRDRALTEAYADFTTHYNACTTLPELAKRLHREVMQANTGNDKVRHKDHFPILLRQLLAHALKRYVELRFNGVLRMCHKNEKWMNKHWLNDHQEDILKGKNGWGIPKLSRHYEQLLASNETQILAFYILGKLLPSTELNHLRGDFLKYLQFMEDIEERTAILYKESSMFVQEEQEKIPLYRQAVQVLSLCAEASGVVGNRWEDYYESKDEFAKTLAPFLDGNIQNFDELLVWQKEELSRLKYTDEKEPILFALVEKGRQNGTLAILQKCYDMPISRHDFIRLEEIEKMPYYEKFHDSASLLPHEKKYQKEYQFLQNKVELHNLQKLNHLIMELYGQLVSWCYMWERDMQYFLLALTVLSGHSPADVLEIFDYQKNPKPTGVKLNDYLKQPERSPIKSLYEKLFLPEGKNQNYLRNSIDHWDYFRSNLQNPSPRGAENPLQKASDTTGRSLLEYYAGMARMMSYAPKLKNNVFARLLHILESQHFVPQRSSTDSQELFTFSAPQTDDWGSCVKLNKGVLGVKCEQPIAIYYFDNKRGNKTELISDYYFCPLQDKNLLPSIEAALLFHGGGKHK